MSDYERNRSSGTGMWLLRYEERPVHILVEVRVAQCGTTDAKPDLIATQLRLLRKFLQANVFSSVINQSLQCGPPSQSVLPRIIFVQLPSAFFPEIWQLGAESRSGRKCQYKDQNPERSPCPSRSSQSAT